MAVTYAIPTNKLLTGRTRRPFEEKPTPSKPIHGGCSPVPVGFRLEP